MLRSLNTHKAKLFTGFILVALIGALIPASVFANNTPLRCAGYGALQSISLSDWEAGIGSWTASTHDVLNPATFDTPDWTAVGSLPDSRAGMAAFVANLNSACAGENETGALSLDSPSIVIPGGALVPRISIEHWFATEFGWDGGNFKISVNGGGFNQIPAAAIEAGAYNATLFPAIQDLQDYNSNPLADEEAFTGTSNGQPTGSWGESRINLLGIAAAGDTIRLRFDFGIDECGGVVGWYVDKVEFYSCEAELLPSDCGNGDLDIGEQCDDGNNFIGDGCSNVCDIEDGWLCSAPAPAGVIPDPGFEGGTPNSSWTEVSNNPFGTPICEVSVCGSGTGSGPADGTYWAWFGGVSQGQEASLTQTVVIPATVTELSFDLEIPLCDSASDYVEVLIDGNQESIIDGSSGLCDVDGYSQHSLDISAYADGGNHEIKLHSETFAVNGGVSNFFIDNVALPRTVSMCRREGTNLTLVKSVINDNQGSAAPSDWTLTASGPSGFSGVGPIVLSGENFDPGTYDLSESGPGGYAASDWVCDGGTQDDADSITLALGEAVTCTITNDDIPPSITVIKTIINDNGGLINNPNAFGLQVDGGSVLDSVTNQYGAGDHTVSEVGLAGYQAGVWGGDCNPDGSIALVIGQAASCTISNDDISPTLTVVRTIVNDNGGLVNNPDLFGLKIDGADLLHNIVNQVDAGAHTLSEVGQAGYQSGVWGGDCNPDGSITLSLGENANCIISSNDITATLSVHKTIINDNGGEVVDKNAFGLRVDSSLVLHAAINPFDAGNYTVSEDGLAGYQPGIWGGDCNPDGTISLALGENASCSITNNDTDDTSLTLVKQVINDSGGNASESAWTLVATGPTGFSGAGPSVSSGSGFAAGSYDLSETGGTAGYSASAWVCVGGTQTDGDTISLSLGEAATCIITNDDIAPTLKVQKIIINDDGGTVTNPNAFGLKVDGNNVLHNVANAFVAGNHNVSEDGLAGYQAGDWGGDCAADGSITLALNQVATCSISNDDIPPTLKVFKTIINNNGGTVSNENLFNLKVDGQTVLHNTFNTFSAGLHTVSEDGLPGYQAGSWGGDCNPDGSIELTAGDSATCTITNDDISPTLTVVKTILNDNGGSVTNPNAFGLRVDSISVLHNVTNPFNAGNHIVSEDGLGGYQPGAWGGDCGPGGEITLALAQNATCTITNDDSDSTSLTLIKQVVNDSGGTANASQWTLTATGPTTISGPGPNVSSGAGFSAGQYDLSETGGVAGYSASAWVCAGGVQDDGDTITLALGDAATCTIINNDKTATLKLLKTIVNDDSGSVSNPNVFGLRVDGGSVLHNATNNFNAGPHLVSEDGLTGYQAGVWGGACNPDGSITLALDQDATCTITNNDIQPTLTVVNTIVSDNGGSITDEDAFGLKVDGAVVLHNVSNAFDVGPHSVSQDGLAGYQPGSWGGDCNQDGSITLALGDTATCTISNDDISPTLTVVKTIINDNGGNVTNKNLFGLKVDDNPVLHNVSNAFNVGTYTVSEVGLSGYQAGSWGGECDAAGNITLTLAQNATCTITNDDITPTLKVVKTIISDNGGLVTDPDAFVLRVDGNSVSHDAINAINAGNHTVSEDGLPGYLPGTWGGDCNADGTITLALAQVATCTITNDDSDATSLTLIKQLINDNGGTASGSDWTLAADGPTAFSGAGPNVSSGEGFAAGTYDLSETGGPAQYTASAWVCVGATQDDADIVSLALGEAAICTITNNDISPTLKVVKTIVSDNGGLITDPNAFDLRVDGVGVLHDVVNQFDAGSHSVSEKGLDGYLPGSWSGDCDAAGNITLALGDTASCSITNDDISPTLTVINSIVNNNGGTTTDPDAFDLSVDGGGVLNNVVNTFDVGSYTVSQSGLAGYQASSWGGDCNPDGSINLVLDQDAVCTITNDDISATITVVSTIINDNGGSVVDPDAFGLRVDGGSVLDGDTNAYAVGSHIVTADGLAGYQASVWGGDCAADGSLSLVLDQDAICTITQNDISATLTVVKTIINNNGGTVVDEDDFVLRVDEDVVLNDVSNSFDTGEHTVSEDGLPGYLPGTWAGDCDTQGKVTLVLDQHATCTITNNDISPTITVVMSIDNDNGGTVLDPNLFGARVDGGSVLDSVTNAFNVGSHLVSADGLPGYQAGVWSGDCAADGSIDLVLSQNAVCTINHDDISPTLTVIKTIINDNGASESDENAAGLKVDGISVSHAASNEFDAEIHLVSEDGLPGYKAGVWGGDCAPDGSITLALDEDATCTITNNDISPSITIINSITSNNGGLVNDPNLFGLRVDGVNVLDGIANTFDVGAHVVSQDGLAGYQAGIWGGDCDAAGNITLELDQDATCTITNDDITPTLTVSKTVVNNNGGLITDENVFTLRVDGNPVLHSISNNFNAGNHVVSEVGLSTYQPGVWGGDCDALGNVTLTLGEASICTISNDDISPTLTIVNNVVNNNGGAVMDANAFGLRVNGGSVLDSVSNNFNAGNHLVTADGLPGYQASTWSGHCDANGNVTLALNQNAICTITYDDISPTLKLVKSIINDNGGTIVDANAFGLKIDQNSVADRAINAIDAGAHMASEDGLAGYMPGSWGGDCNPDGSINLILDQDATCTITNNDITPTLTVFKTIINDNGGTQTNPSAFGLKVDGNAVLHNTPNNYDAGPHMVSENGLAGYIPGTWGGDCLSDGSITLALGQNATCTISNDDSNSTSLTLIKVVVNDNGGSASANQWTLTATGATGFSGVGPNVSNGPDFFAGSYDLSESGGPPGYQSSAWNCLGGTQTDFDTIKLALGEAAICTITNDDISPTITVVKTVVNDNGGTITNLNAFGLRVDGDLVSHNTSNAFDAGVHLVTEDGSPGYVAGPWGGDCNSNGELTLELAQQATCTITNDDDGSTSLQLIKQVVNDNGGQATASQWLLTAAGPTGFSGNGPNVSNDPGFSAGTYHLSESNGPDGYSTGDWVCVGGTQDDADTVTLALGEMAVCTLVNDDISPTLKVVKTIVNDHGGTITDENEFGFKVDNQDVLHNVTNDFDAGPHSVSEQESSRYTAGPWGGDCNPNGSINLELADVAICTITNDDKDLAEVIFKSGFENQ